MQDYSTWKYRRDLYKLIETMISDHGDSNTCLEWPFTKNGSGYGIIQFEGTRWRVHRLTWKITHGRIYRGLDILHSCDNPPCFCIRHLFQGTNDDNIADKLKKGRQRNGISLGEKHGNAVLTNDLVRAIRKRWEEGITQTPIAKEFGFSKELIDHIVKGRSWKHVL